VKWGNWIGQQLRWSFLFTSFFFFTVFHFVAQAYVVPSASWVPGLQIRTTTPGSCLYFYHYSQDNRRWNRTRRTLTYSSCIPLFTSQRISSATVRSLHLRTETNKKETLLYACSILPSLSLSLPPFLASFLPPFQPTYLSTNIHTM
jgi:hypothetical protein